ncbi:WhiB family transcriptional regulator [Mycobacterium avium]|uniref:WhiB family transcriptional regulator n=1 Tax=Mycobacterium avium TaxID=1764 RepID=UPI001596D16D|nr:WhiB family transcriptional regulator [Mycobacterium avium]
MSHRVSYPADSKWVRRNVQLAQPEADIGDLLSKLESIVQSEYFFAGHERELRDLVRHPRSIDLSEAACAGIDPNLYHPDGPLDELSAARCSTCPVRMGCLALALQAEDPQAREGWYGGVGPDDRAEIARDLKLPTVHVCGGKDPATEAVRLRASGLTVNQVAAYLACSRRTVQRYCRRSLFEAL